MPHSPQTGHPGALRFGAKTTIAALGVLLAAAQLPACGDEEEPEGPNIQAFVTSASLLEGGGPAVLRNDPLPEGSADGPVVTVEESATIINGGSLQIPVTSDTNFEQLLIGLTTTANPTASPPLEAGPVNGYFEVSLTQPATSATVVLTIAQALPVNSVTLDVAGAAGGTQGVPAHQNASVVAVGSGELQVSVSWDAASDVDIHLVEPDGTEIYYGATSSPSGGALDLDSNAGCTIDNVNNENITYTEAPPGEYTVRLDYYAACEAEQTSYVVTVQLPGQQPQVFNGVFSGDGDRGGAGSGELITTFTITG
jgi:hypothetical protein